MRFQITFFLILTIFLSGCTSSTDTVNTNNAPNKPANTTNVNADNPLATTKKPEVAATNNAPTLAPIVQSYYTALRTKDEAGVRKYLSQSALKYWQNEMKDEDQTSLLKMMEETEAPIEVSREVRNEKIAGDTATAEIRGGTLGVWTPIAFVKENGEWKFASPKDSLALQEVGSKQ